VARRVALAAVVAAALFAGCRSGSSSQPPAKPATTTAKASTVPARDTTTKRAVVHVPAPRRIVVPHHTYVGSVTAIGDSVMLDAAPVLQRRLPAIDIDASTDRAVETGITALEAKVARGQRDGPIVFHLGNNSSFRPSQVGHVLQIASGRRVVLVTDHCSYCAWVPPNNSVMHAFCTRVGRCFVADWESLANAHPEWFGADGVHMPVGGAGAQAYTQLVVDALYAR
jgi:hypothetical protein